LRAARLGTLCLALAGLPQDVARLHRGKAER